jgi:hypothetical protein
MPITINGSGTVTGISVGGLPDGIVTAPELNGAQTGSAPIYGCRAWVNFDGTRNEADTGASTNGANVKIRASGNVTSVLKNGTGDYTVNFATAMVDANYSATSIGPSIGNGGGIFQVAQNTAATPTSSAYRVSIQSTSGTMSDNAFLSLVFFR